MARGSSQATQDISPVHTDDESEITLDDPGTSSTAQEQGPAPKKRYRPSKKDIPDYPFSPDQVQEFAEFVRDNAVLYDKRHPEWSLRNVKDDLWKQLAARFPDCTWLQARKFFEAKRTAFGKIEKKESARSGAAAKTRSSRDEGIIRTWGFLSGHIAHEPTIPSQHFSPPHVPRESTPRRPQHGDDDAASTSSGLSAYSIERRRREKKLQSGEGDIQVVSPRRDEQTLAGHAIKELLSQAHLLREKQPTTGHEKEIQRFLGYLETKLQRVSPVNFGMLSNKILELVTALEEPPEGTTRIKDARQIIGSYYVMPPTAPQGPTPQMFQQPPQPLPSTSTMPPPMMPLQYQQQPYQQYLQQAAVPQHQQQGPSQQQQPPYQQFMQQAAVPQHQQQAPSQLQQPLTPASAGTTQPPSPWPPTFFTIGSPLPNLNSPIKTPFSGQMEQMVEKRNPSPKKYSSLTTPRKDRDRQQAEEEQFD